MNDANAYDAIKKTMNLCDDLKGPDDVERIYTYVKGAYNQLALYNLPYAVEKLVANPVKEACGKIKLPNEVPANEGLTEEQTWLLKSISDAANVWYGKGEGECHNLAEAAASNTLAFGNAWKVLGCNEMFMPVADDALTTMFLENEIDYKHHGEQCVEQWGSSPDYHYTQYTFGGFNPKKDFQSLSNAIILNGSKDPW